MAPFFMERIKVLQRSYIMQRNIFEDLVCQIKPLT